MAPAKIALLLAIAALPGLSPGASAPDRNPSETGEAISGGLAAAPQPRSSTETHSIVQDKPAWQELLILHQEMQGLRPARCDMDCVPAREHAITTHGI